MTTAKQIKQTLPTVLHYLEWDKYIDLQDDEGTDIELFLSEFNRYRTMLGLCPYMIQKRIPMTGRGDWHKGRGEKVRFVPDKAPKTKTPIQAAVRVEDAIPRGISSDPPENPSPLQRISKAALTEKLRQHYEDLEIKTEKVQDNTVTLFFSNNSLMGSWCKGQGWYLI